MTAKHVKSLLTEGRVMYLKPLDTVHLWIRHAPTVLNQLVEMCYYPVLMQRKSHTESREKFSTSVVSIYTFPWKLSRGLFHLILQPHLCVRFHIRCGLEHFHPTHFLFHFSIPDQQTKSKGFLCVWDCVKWMENETVWWSCADSYF